MLIMRSPKGWTWPKKLDGKPLENSFRSHQVPVGEPQKNSEHLALVEEWLRSYGWRQDHNGYSHLSSQDLVTNKRLVGRAQDLMDVESLLLSEKQRGQEQP